MHRLFENLDSPNRHLTRALLRGLPRRMIPPSAEERPKPAKWGDWTDWATDPRPGTIAERNDLAHAPWSWPTLSLAMRIAIAYPLVLAFVQWAIVGGALELAGLEMFEDESALWLRRALFGLIATTLLARTLASTIPRGVIDKQSRWFSRLDPILPIMLLGFAVAGNATLISLLAFSVAFSVALTGTFVAVVAGAFVAVVTSAFVNAGAIGFEGVGSVAFLAAVAIFAAVAVAGATRKGWGLSSHLCLVLFAGLAASLALIRLPLEDSVPLTLILAFVLLPAINALFDWLSYGLTLWLLQRGYGDEEARTKKSRWIWPLVYGAIDLAAAFVLFAALGGCIVTVLLLINAARGETLIDVIAILRAPTDHVWVIAMVASTLLPTLVHVTLGGLSALTWLPQRVWAGLLGGIGQTTGGSLDERGTFAPPILAIVIMATFAFLFIGLGLGGMLVWQGGGWAMGLIAGWLLDYGQWVQALLS